ncbi:hypothetical protein ACLBKU_17555, partial [Erythrobacter sp. NE805]|uniref:hypothetical protein n=1 Tax=Erythrobacter sp. NE805 TaxID=3389875 RepID=UPI00396B283A
GCKRGTTKVEPGWTIICGKCWRRAPKDMRILASTWRARANRFDRKGDQERAEIAGRWANRAFENIRKLLSGETEQCWGMDPLMAEDLRKAGLI